MKQKNYSITSVRGKLSDRRERRSAPRSRGNQSRTSRCEVASSNLPKLSLRKVLFALTMMGTMAGSATFIGCDNPIQTAYQEQISVSSFLYANGAVDSVVLHRTTPLGAYFDDLDYAVDSALVIITSNGISDTLLPAALKGRYYLPASKLTIQGGQTYDLYISAPNHQTGGRHFLTAATTVPMPIHLDSLVQSFRGQTLMLDTNNLANFAFLVTAGPIDEPNREYLLSITALDTSYGRTPRRSGPPLDTGVVTRYSFVETAPAIPVTTNLLTFFGPERLAFYAIDTNWVDYQRQLMGGADFQPTLNHIVGGIGVFASAGRDTVSFILKPK